MNRSEALDWCMDELKDWPENCDRLRMPPQGWLWYRDEISNEWILISEHNHNAIDKSMTQDEKSFNTARDLVASLFIGSAIVAIFTLVISLV